jgi:hypothetical protein
MQDVDLSKFKIHRPVDPSDPGFEIVGVKLRWISGKVRETSSSSNLWIPLRKSKMPPKLLEHIENFHPNAFNAGDTYRRGSGELILAYAPVEHVRKHRVELDMLNREQASRANILQTEGRQTNKDYAKIEEYEGSAGSIPDEFLNKKNR